MKPGIQGVLTQWNPAFMAFRSRDHGPLRALQTRKPPQVPEPEGPRARTPPSPKAPEPAGPEPAGPEPRTPKSRAPPTAPSSQDLPDGQVDEAAGARGQAVDRERRQRALWIAEVADQEPEREEGADPG